MGTATSQSQVILKTDGGYNGFIDGVWGRNTQAAYDRASAATKARILGLFHTSGKMAPFERRWVPAGIVQTYIAMAAAQLGVPELTPIMERFIELEAVKKAESGVIYYDSNSTNGGSKGLMQIQRGAWETARGADKSLPGYDKVYDPETNIRAGVAYAKVNAAILRRVNVDVNAETLYLAHNQGPGFFTRGARTAVDKQSATVQRLISKYS